jgi:UDP-glucose 4-epimerase
LGTRHGEKLYESLVSREEMASVEDMGDFYRIPADNRDLNYSLYYTDGTPEISESRDYTSHNTQRLTVPKVKELLMGLGYIQDQLNSKMNQGA